MKPTAVASTLMLIVSSLLSPAVHAAIELEHNQAKQLVSEGKILSLDLTLSQVQAYCDGKLVDAHLFHAQGRWQYDLQIKSANGELISLDIDATTGQHQTGKPLPDACVPHKN
ncbi:MULTISPECIES: PepSY domain-containing protein [Shewanella]|uniref:Peptidase M4 n=1 Tax=Shewanella marisflavi TaxID=260364 RepID=A0ABX5WJH6_9GAMM|nr:MULTISPECIES: hypothetical protein [Shewanella]MCL1041581.1 hypothetical protein [Shewanella marisflavi]QDF74166.1 hypothetical protein FGA12_02755 [Shewanella marisflavi]